MLDIIKNATDMILNKTRQIVSKFKKNNMQNTEISDPYPIFSFLGFAESYPKARQPNSVFPEVGKSGNFHDLKFSRKS